jgi:hypothetical protein
MDAVYEKMSQDLQMITLYALRACELAKGVIPATSRVCPLNLEDSILREVWKEIGEDISPVNHRLKQTFDKWLPQDWKFVCHSINNMWNKYLKRRANPTVGIFKLQESTKQKQVAFEISHDKSEEEEEDQKYNLIATLKILEQCCTFHKGLDESAT